MQNVLLNAILKQDGNIDGDALMSIIPNGHRMTGEQAAKYGFGILSQTPLTDEFIDKHFNLLDTFQVFLKSNPSEWVLLRNLPTIAPKILDDFNVAGQETSSLLDVIMDNDKYTQEAKEKLVVELIERSGRRLHMTAHENLMTALNAYTDKFSLQFVLDRCVGDDPVFVLLAAALRRDDIDEEFLKADIHLISYQELSHYLAAYTPEDDEDVLTPSPTGELIKRLLVHKIVKEGNLVE